MAIFVITERSSCWGHCMYRTSLFSRFAKWAAYATGHPLAFLLAVGIILGWALTGPFFHFSDTWQLVINTGTTIIIRVLPIA